MIVRRSSHIVRSGRRSLMVPSPEHGYHRLKNQNPAMVLIVAKKRKRESVITDPLLTQRRIYKHHPISTTKCRHVTKPAPPLAQDRIPGSCIPGPR